MKKTGFACLFILILPFLYGFDWPIEEKTIVSTFGQACGSQFSTGIKIGTREQDVKPITEGEICFYSEINNSPHAIPSGLGNYCILEHQGGLRSVYSHLKDGSILLSKTFFEDNDVIGVTGISGASYIPNINLTVIDTEYNQIMNPLLLLPPVSDANAPVIQAVYIKRDEGIIRMQEQNSMPAGHAEIILSVYDPGENVKYFNPMAPFELLLLVNGIEVKRLIFEGLEQQIHEISLINSDSVQSDELFIEDTMMNLGQIQLSPGNNRIEITASDFLGNETTTIITILATE